MKTLREIRDELYPMMEPDGSIFQANWNNSQLKKREAFDSGFKAAIEMLRSKEGKDLFEVKFGGYIKSSLTVADWLEEQLAK